MTKKLSSDEQLGESLSFIVRSNLLTKLFFLLVLFTFNSYVFDKKELALINESDFNPRGYWIVNRMTFLLQWDGYYFFNAAREGYNNVKQHAFYPGLPMVLRYLHMGLRYLPPYAYLLDYFELDAFAMLMTGFFLNFALHVVNNLLIYALARLRGLPERECVRIGLFFAVSSISMYHITLYSESLYLFIVLVSLCILEQAFSKRIMLTQISSLKFSIICGIFALSTTVRSVGILNAAYVGYPLFLEMVLLLRNKGPQMTGIQRGITLFEGVLKMFSLLASFLLPTGYLFVTNRTKFCKSGGQEDPAYKQPEYCKERYGFFYTHVQEKYWGVRFLGLLKDGNSEVYLLLLSTLPIILNFFINWLKEVRLKDLFTLNIRRLLRDKDLNDQMIRVFPDVVIMLIFVRTFFFYAHPNSAERFFMSYPQYYFMMNDYQREVGYTNSKSLYQSIRKYWIVGWLILRMILTPVLFVTNIHPI